MKHFTKILMAMLLVLLIATPVSADNGGGDDHLCFAGDTVVRSEEMPDNVVLFGCGARVQSGAKVNRDVVSFGGDVVIEQGVTVGRSVVVFGGDLQLAGQVGGDVTVFGGRITLEPTAVVARDVLAFGGAVDKKEGAVVRGNIERNAGNAFPNVRVGPFVPNLSSRNDWGLWNFFAGIFQSFIVTLGLIALGALIMVFLPNQLKLVSDVAQKSALPSLGVGCLTWLVVPPLMILFILTCLGIPLSMVLGVLFAAAGMFGWVALGAVLGERLTTALKAQNIVPILAMAIGLLVLWFVTAVPVIGGLIWLFAAALAIGAVVLTRFGTRPYPMPVTSMLATPPVSPMPPTPPSTTDAGPSI
jgi:hypothetical protein